MEDRGNFSLNRKSGRRRGRIILSRGISWRRREGIIHSEGKSGRRIGRKVTHIYSRGEIRE